MLNYNNFKYKSFVKIIVIPRILRIDIMTIIECPKYKALQLNGLEGIKINSETIKVIGLVF